MDERNLCSRSLDRPRPRLLLATLKGNKVTEGPLGRLLRGASSRGRLLDRGELMGGGRTFLSLPNGLINNLAKCSVV